MKKTAPRLRTHLSTFVANPVSPLVPWASPEDNGVLLHSGWQLRDLPSLNYSDYLSLLPGERCTITMRFKTSELKGENAKLNLDGGRLMQVDFMRHQHGINA